MANTLEHDQDFYEAVNHDDDLIAVVRTQLYMEIQLNQIIEKLLPRPIEFENARIGWGQRVKLACALGLKPKYRKPLEKIWKIRNKFAHRPDVILEAAWVNELYSSLSEEDRDTVVSVYEKLRTKDKILPKFSKLPHKQKFTVIAISLHSMLKVAVSEASKKD